MFRPMTVTSMKNVKSNKIDLKAASPKFGGKAVVYVHTCIVSLSIYSGASN